MLPWGRWRVFVKLERGSLAECRRIIMGVNRRLGRCGELSSSAFVVSTNSVRAVFYRRNVVDGQ